MFAMNKSKFIRLFVWFVLPAIVIYIGLSILAAPKSVFSMIMDNIYQLYNAIVLKLRG